MFTTPWACKITEHIFLLKNGIIRDPESGSKKNNTRDRDWKKIYVSGPGGFGIENSSRFEHWFGPGVGTIIPDRNYWTRPDYIVVFYSDPV